MASCSSIAGCSFIMGSHLLEPISAPQDGHLQQHWHMCLNPIHSRLLSPISAPRDGLLQQHRHKCTHSTRIHFLEPIAAPQDDLLQQHVYKPLFHSSLLVKVENGGW